MDTLYPMPPSSLGFVTSLPQRLSSAYFDAIQFGHARRQLCFSLCMGIATTYISSPFQGLEMYFLLLLLDVCLSMPICFPSTARLCCFNVFFPQPRQLNANDQEWIIGRPMKASAGDRAYMQSLISLALSLCRIFPIDDSIGDSLLGFRQALFFSLIVISSLTVLMSPLVASLVFTCFEFSFSILLASIRWKGI